MLQIFLLGEGAVVDEATGRTRSCSSRSLALLAFLVIHTGSPQSRQRLAGLFWPDSTDAQALTNLRRELHHIRRVLEDDAALAVTSKRLCWYGSATCRVDVTTFVNEMASARDATDPELALTHAVSALEQYRGELLPGEYGGWLDDSRESLHRRCVDVCDLICGAATESGYYAVALSAARRRVELEPLEELGYRTLMRVQAGLGDRAGAVSTYHRCAAVLERELNIAPDETTRATVDALLARTSNDTREHHPPAEAPGTSSRRLGYATLTGRHEELRRLVDVWRDTVDGPPRLLLIRGDPGVGKTRLASECAEAARDQGAVVATARCFDASGRIPLGPVADWLGEHPLSSSIGNLDPVWRAEVDRLVPSNSDVPAASDAIRAKVDAWQRRRFFEGLVKAVTATHRPVVLVLDNLQWCDPETLAFLSFCLHRAGAPVAVLATLRDGAVPDPQIGQWTTELRSEGLLTEVPLSPLEQPETARLVRAITGHELDEQESQLVQAATGGYPLYVVEAARVDAGDGSSFTRQGGLTSVLGRRLDQATESAQQIAALAAAVGRDFSLDLLTEASNLTPDAVVGAIDELWRHRLVRSLGDGYDFSHDLLRDTAYERLSPATRWLMHRRIAQALEFVHRDDTDVVAGQLARQYELGGRPDRAVGYCERAAAVASRRFAHADAIRFAQQAVDLVRRLPAGPNRDARELAILENAAAPINAEHGYASDLLEQAMRQSLELAERLGRRTSVLKGLMGLWACQFVQGRVSEGHRTVQRALDLVDQASEFNGQAHFGYAGTAVSLGRPTDALRHFAVTCENPQGTPSLTVGTRPEIHAGAWSAHAWWLVGHTREALDAAAEAIDAARGIDHPYDLTVALAYAGITYQMARHIDALDEAVDELGRLCERYGFAYYREWGLVLGGWLRMDETGLETAQRGIENLRSSNALTRMPYWLSVLADLHERLGQSATARAVLDSAIVDARARDDVWWLPEVLRQRAAYDDPRVAADRLADSATMARSHGSTALLSRIDGVPRPP